MKTVWWKGCKERCGLLTYGDKGTTSHVRGEGRICRLCTKYCDAGDGSVLFIISCSCIFHKDWENCFRTSSKTASDQKEVGMGWTALLQACCGQLGQCALHLPPVISKKWSLTSMLADIILFITVYKVICTTETC